MMGALTVEKAKTKTKLCRCGKKLEHKNFCPWVGKAVAHPLIKLWVDDEREAPEGWLHVKNVETAKQQFIHNTIDELSLDHDLGGGAGGDGSRLIVWMAEKDIWPRKRPVCHSMNPVGKQYIEGVIQRYWHG